MYWIKYFRVSGTKVIVFKIHFANYTIRHEYGKFILQKEVWAVHALINRPVYMEQLISFRIEIALWRLQHVPYTLDTKTTKDGSLIYLPPPKEPASTQLQNHCGLLYGEHSKKHVRNHILDIDQLFW